MRPALIVHGGAGPWREDDHVSAVAGVHEAARRGWMVLQDGGSALDAVEAATRYLEDHPIFDAGYGSHLTRYGEVEMDALIVDGRVPDFGAVAGVRHVQNPISLARKVLAETPHCFFIGNGADALAVQMGFPIVPNLHLVTERELLTFREQREQPAQFVSTGTVGAVALDQQGHIATATSTGGTPNKPRGRVGDSPLFGAGGYAEPHAGASATGVGENIMRVLLSRYAVEQVGRGQSAQQAATAAAHHINSVFDPSNAGIIIVDQQGTIGAAHTTPYMPIGWVNESGEIRASMGGGITGLTREDI